MGLENTIQKYQKNIIKFFIECSEGEDASSVITAIATNGNSRALLFAQSIEKGNAIGGIEAMADEGNATALLYANSTDGNATALFVNAQNGKQYGIPSKYVEIVFNELTKHLILPIYRNSKEFLEKYIIPYHNITNSRDIENK